MRQTRGQAIAQRLGSSTAHESVLPMVVQETTRTSTHVLVLENNRLAREGLIHLLGEQKDFHTDALPATTGTISQYLFQHRPDIVLLGSGHGVAIIDLVLLCRETRPTARVVLMA